MIGSKESQTLKKEPLLNNKTGISVAKAVSISGRFSSSFEEEKKYIYLFLFFTYLIDKSYLSRFDIKRVALVAF